MYRRIVAGTDLSKTARVATDRSAALARAFGAELVLVHVGTDPGPPLQELADSYGARCHVVGGNPAEALIRATEDVQADLLIVGNIGMRGAKRFMLGNVPNKVSHHAVTDLLIVRTDPAPSSTDTYGKILAGTDGSDTATAAVERAADLAAALRAGLVVVCAYDPPSEQELESLRASSGDVYAAWDAGKELRGVPEEFRWRIAGAAQAEDVLERAEDHTARHGVEAEVRAVEGGAAEVLISTAEEEGFELIVVGSVGMSGAKRFTLGNVPHRLSHHAPTDLLILKTA